MARALACENAHPSADARHERPTEATRAPSLLIVEDDPGALALLTRIASRFAEISWAQDVDGALEKIADRAFSGILSDLSLGPRAEGGFEVLRAAARAVPGVPLALITGSNDRAVVNRGASLGATYLCKPFTGQHLRPFLDRVRARIALVDQLASTVSDVADEWQLRPRERELLVLIVAGHGRQRICEIAGYGKATYKTYVNRLLAHAKCARTTEMALAVHRLAHGTPQRGRRFDRDRGLADTYCAASSKLTPQLNRS